MTLRGALIGCGRIGSTMADDPLMAGDIFTHAEAYSVSASTRLVAVCDADRECAERCAKRWNVAAAYTDVRRMLDEAQPDIVSVCTPDHTHYSIARTVIEEGGSVRALLCEKPLATRLDDAEDLVRRSGERGKRLAVVYMRRFAPNMRALRAFLEAGEIGPVRAVGGWYTKGTLHNGTHWFDLLRMLAGEVEWVEARDVLLEGGPDPTLDVRLGMAGGAEAFLRGWDRESYSLFEMEILAERGRVAITDSGHCVTVERAAPSPRYSNYIELRREAHVFGDRRNLMLAAVEDLAVAVTKGRPPLSSGEDGVAALRIGTAALKAAETGSRIHLFGGFPA